MTDRASPLKHSVSYTAFLICLLVIAFSHALDLVSLPFAVMSDSFAYVSWGLDVVGLNSGPNSYNFMPRYQDFPYFPLGYPLVIGLCAMLSRVAAFDLLLLLQHVLLVLSVGVGLYFLRTTPVAFWVFLICSLLSPEMHSYPQTIMSEGLAMSMHLLLIVSVFAQRKAPSWGWSLCGGCAGFFVTLIRGTPLLQIPLMCAVFFLIGYRRALAPAVGAIVAGGVLVVYTYQNTGYPSLTTSDGFHLHNRLVFSQNLPLHNNAAEDKIVTAIGEETYRRPHWFVVDALYERLGMKQGPEVNKLLADASKPYIWIAPVTYLKNTFVLCLKSLGLNNDILLSYSHGWPIEEESKAREIRVFPWWYAFVDDLPGMRGNIVGPVFIVIAIIAVCSLTFKQRLTAEFYAAISYATLGLLIASSLSLDDYRRVREFFPVVIFCMALLSQALVVRLSSLRTRGGGAA